MPEVETQTDFDSALFCRNCSSFFIEKEKEEEKDESESESESEDEDEDESVSPLFEEDPEDVEEYIHREIHTWLSFPANLLRISSSNIEQIITADVVAVLMEEWIDAEACAETDRAEIADWVAAVVADHLSYHVEVPPRQGGRPEPMTPLRRAKLHNKLRILNAAPQVEQRTPAWFEQRYNLLTASNVYKALGTEAQKNSLIVEKCMSYEEFVADSAKRGGLGIGTAMGWGIKYEPLTAMLYERMNPGTRLGEYGCIVHPEWPFLGASPDGINVEPGSEKYGRMVEIKNIVNRDITGIPLEHYWIQMQVQMEVCDLDECDFVETRFKEFEGGKDAYLASDKEWKGCVLMMTPTYLVPGETKAFYTHYICDGSNGTDAWIEEQREKWGEGYRVSEIAYWYLDQYSCVLVKRNQEWFDVAVQEMESLWGIIVEERISGCEHRKPKKRETGRGRGCLVDVVKLE